MSLTERPAECEICGDVPAGREAAAYKCPSCTKIGFDSCCIPAGSGTECVECEQNDDGGVPLR